LLSYQNTPVQKIESELTEKAGVKLFIKREDLNHAYVSGNKWWKLRDNLQEAIQTGKKTLLTFGGAYSNHLYATAAAAHELGLTSVGIVRGEETLPLNKTLAFAQSRGMKLQYITREDYRLKDDAAFLSSLRRANPDAYIIPEGGTNSMALSGVRDFAALLPTDMDYICCACGTGGTLAGLILGNLQAHVMGFSSLKGSFMTDAVRHWLANSDVKTSWSVHEEYHFGGYAKSTPELMLFMDDFEKTYGVPLDQVYTAKAMYGVLDLMSKGFFPSGAKVLFIHTGGLQGRAD
jgi:1-aminocyclopropane-1-carboxylate deaminase